MTKAAITKSFRKMSVTDCADLLEDLTQVFAAKEREVSLPDWQEKLLKSRRDSYHKDRARVVSHAQFDAKLVREIRSMRMKAKRKSR